MIKFGTKVFLYFIYNFLIKNKKFLCGYIIEAKWSVPTCSMLINGVLEGYKRLWNYVVFVWSSGVCNCNVLKMYISVTYSVLCLEKSVKHFNNHFYIVIVNSIIVFKFLNKKK